MDVNSITKSSTAITDIYANSSSSKQPISDNSLKESDLNTKNVELKDETKNINNPDSKKDYNEQDLKKAVNKLNKFLEDDNTRAEYSYHKVLGTLMIKIIDQDTKKVLLEVPPKKILDMVASMCQEFGIIDKKA